MFAGEPKVVRTPLEKWELSLHACTSFSQLYVHLALLGKYRLLCFVLQKLLQYVQNPSDSVMNR